MGVGLGRSIQAYGYLPEAENDSIFAIYAEKFGFIGSVALLGLYGSLLLRILNVMQRAPTRAMQLITTGVFTWFAVQGTINIAAMLGLIPLKGITLPFISYGGTSLIFSMAALGLVFHISKYTLMRKASFTPPKQKGDTRDEDSRHWRRDSRPRYTVTRRSL
jgi:cell division protein FtsW